MFPKSFFRICQCNQVFSFKQPLGQETTNRREIAQVLELGGVVHLTTSKNIDIDKAIEETLFQEYLGRIFSS